MQQVDRQIEQRQNEMKTVSEKKIRFKIDTEFYLKHVGSYTTINLY